MSLSVVFRPAAQVELAGFPYAIHFTEEPDAIVILAVFHTRRDPGQLRDRS
jgi:hypothetical protein